MDRLSNKWGHLLLMVLPLTLFLGCQQNTSPTTPTRKASGVPILTAENFDKTVARHKGRILLVNFFTTWCEPCREELPVLVTLAKKYQAKGVDVIAISLDKGGEKTLRPFLKKIKIPFPIYLGDTSLMDLLNIQEVPTTYLYNRKGKRVHVLKGAAKLERLVSVIEPLIDK